MEEEEKGRRWQENGQTYEGKKVKRNDGEETGEKEQVERNKEMTEREGRRQEVGEELIMEKGEK